MVERLNEWRPELLTGYPSVLRMLADAQLGGRLRIAPRFVWSVAEVFTREDRRRVYDAWAVNGNDVYGATEYTRSRSSALFCGCTSGGPRPRLRSWTMRATRCRPGHWVVEF